MKKTIIISIILVSLVLLSSCTNSNNTTISVHKGYTGLDLTFSKTTPTEVYENTSFYSRIIIKNIGSYSVTNEDSPAIAFLTTDKLYLQHDPWVENKRSFYVIGKSTEYPQGDSLILDLPELRVPKIQGNLQNPSSDLFVNLCYPYRTTYSKNVCLDFDLYDQDEREKVCHAEEFSVSGGQGAPVAITKILPLMKSDENQRLKPEFIITIENKGDGTLSFDKDKNFVEDNTCIDAHQHTENWNLVKIYGTISNIELNCQTDIVRLINGKAEVRCVASEALISQTNYYSPLTINVDYLYIDSFSQTLDIIRTRTFEDISYTVHQNCQNKGLGDACDTNMICDANQQCIDKCSYCNRGEDSIPGKVDCTGITSDFGCTCSTEECDLLDDAQCKKAYCEVKQCCDSTLSSRPLGAAYTFKEESETEFTNPFSNLEENTKLNDSLDYRFKPVYPNSNQYCGISIYTKNLVLLKKYEGFPKPCSSENNFLDYEFEIVDRGDNFNLIIETFDEYDDATTTRTESILFKVEDPDPLVCDEEGQIIENKVCTREDGEFYLVTKCVYCNIDSSKSFCQNVNFIPDMGCDCSVPDNAYFNYTTNDLCLDGTYCCKMNEEFDYTFYLNIYNNEDLVIHKEFDQNSQQIVSLTEMIYAGNVTISYGTIPTQEGNAQTLRLKVEGYEDEVLKNTEYERTKIFSNKEFTYNTSSDFEDSNKLKIEFIEIESNAIESLIGDININLNIQ